MAGDFVTLNEASEILASRGVFIGAAWLAEKCRDGKIDGAEKLGTGNRSYWVVPREWAQTYTKVKAGRPRRDGNM